MRHAYCRHGALGVDMDLKWVWLALTAMFVLGMLMHTLNIR
jgi:hypothetical protein